MFTQKTLLETKRKEKVFTLSFDSPTTLVELIDVLCEMRASCLQALSEQIDIQDKETKEKVDSISPKAEESKKESE